MCGEGRGNTRAAGSPAARQIHGDDDQIVPIAISALRTAKIVRTATLRVYPGLPHGMCATHKGQINADLLAFLRA